MREQTKLKVLLGGLIFGMLAVLIFLISINAKMSVIIWAVLIVFFIGIVVLEIKIHKGR